MDNPTLNTQADGDSRPVFRDHAEEIAWHQAQRDREAGVGQSFECSYCGTMYTKRDARQVLCLRCTAEDYL